MDAIAADLNVGVGGAEESEGASPFLTLDGFSGSLDHLLTLARGQKIDLADISITALVDQLTAALRQAPATTPLSKKGDWVVMAAWLVQLRARLPLPADSPAQQDAMAEADQLRKRLVALEEMQALAAWLARRPQVGHQVFARGRPYAVADARDRILRLLTAEPGEVTLDQLLPDPEATDGTAGRNGPDR